MVRFSLAFGSVHEYTVCGTSFSGADVDLCPSFSTVALVRGLSLVAMHILILKPVKKRESMRQRRMENS
jgi:hypothetical protein